MNQHRFHLRSVDILQVLTKYANHEYANVSQPISINLVDSGQQIIQNKPPSKVYEIPEFLSNGRPMVFSGYLANHHGIYEEINLNIEHNCMYCLRKITPGILGNNHGRTIGIPVARICEYQNDEKIYRYYLIDVFCTFNCAYAELRLRLNYPTQMYSHSIIYFADIYEACTGKGFGELKPASDKRFLKRWNGPLTDEQFHAHHGTYIDKPQYIHLAPATQIMEK